MEEEQGSNAFKRLIVEFLSNFFNIFNPLDFNIITVFKFKNELL